MTPVDQLIVTDLIKQPTRRLYREDRVWGMGVVPEEDAATFSSYVNQSPARLCSPRT